MYTTGISKMPRIKFMSIEIDNLTMDEAIQSIDELVIKNKNSFVVTPNVDHLVQLEHGGKLCEVYKNADLILTDGKPLIWISKWYGTPIKEKISGSDLFPKICKMSAERGYRMFFLGAAEGVASKAAKNLQRKYPGLQIAGTYSPKFNFEKDKCEVNKIIKIIQKSKPHILIVGLGCPKQELFIFNNKEKLGVPVSLGLGASLDFEAGNVKRAPKWMADHGPAWLYRIFQDPKRLARRYLLEDIKILSMAVKYKNK